MKVKRTSWHYRLNSTLWTSVSNSGRNLCRYFWMTVWTISLYSGVGLAIFVFFIGLFNALFDGGYYHAIGRIIVLAFIVLSFVLPGMAISFFRQHFGEVEITTPTLLSEFIRAKKEKVCPFIEFE